MDMLATVLNTLQFIVTAAFLFLFKEHVSFTKEDNNKCQKF